MTSRTWGHYQILDPLGSGGMGEVYKARDNRLNRLVAIKVLRQDLAATPSRKQSFVQEAKSASALNHPNIVRIYDIFEHDGLDCLVMEYIAGKTLHELIGKRGMPVKEALRIAAQIADGLSSAHRAGLVHRDIKPSNVIVPDSGPVRILDFGLAKLSESEKIGEEDATRTVGPLTEEGVVVGTAAYMSPEQAQGKPVDFRSDIFSFGTVLYGMLTGQWPFREDTKVGTLAAILHRDPPPITSPDIPRALSRVVARCLRKNPEERWQSLSDVKQILGDIAADYDAPQESAPAGRRHVGWFLAGTSCVAIALLIYGILRFLPKFTSPGAPTIATLHKVTSDTGLSGYPAISRDGKLIAFASDRAKEDNLDIWIQQTGGGDPIQLTRDPADETDPSFSPDATMIAFRSEKDGGGIFVMPSLGGTPILLAPRGRNPRFSPDGRWIAYSVGGTETSTPGSAGVFIINSTGGEPRAIHPEMATATSPVWSPGSDRILVLGRQDAKAPTRPELDWWILPIDHGSPVRSGAYARLNAQNLNHPQFPQVFPVALDWRDAGGDRILFSAFLGEAANLWELPLKGADPAQRVTLGPGLHSRGRWSADGRLVFAAEELNFDVWRQPLNPATGLPQGSMNRLADEGAEELTPSVSWDGTKIAYVSHRSSSWSLRIRAAEPGPERVVLSSLTRIPVARLSGDGSRVLYTSRAGSDYALYSIPSAGGAIQKLCDGCGAVMGPAMDGQKILYEPTENEDAVMYDSTRRSTVKVAVRPTPDLLFSGSRFSRDDKWIAFHALRNSTNTGQIWIVPAGTLPAPQSEWIPITDGSTLDRDPAWSPDGRFLYFVSERDGFRCIWACPLNPVTKRPSAKAFPVRHFHSARFSLRHVGTQGYLTGLSVGEGGLVFSIGELKANVWVEENGKSN